MRTICNGVTALFVVAATFLTLSVFGAEASDINTESSEESLQAPISAENPAVFTESSSRVIELDETVISGNQELPKVLYILPWRQPEGLPEIELETEFTEMTVFRRLYPPAYRRELEYFRNLESTVNQAAKSQ